MVWLLGRLCTCVCLYAEVRRACAWAIGTAGEYSSPSDSGRVQRRLGARAAMQFTVRRSAVVAPPSSGGVASAAGRTSPGAGKLTGGGTGVRAAGAFSAGRWAHVSPPPVLPVSQFGSREAFDHAVQVVALTAHKETPGGSFVEGRAPLPWRGCLWLAAHALIFSIHRSHSLSFTRAQGIPKYKIGFGRGRGWESWGKFG